MIIQILAFLVGLGLGSFMVKRRYQYFLQGKDQELNELVKQATALIEKVKQKHDSPNVAVSPDRTH